jgi:GTP cyclohydrolase IA
MNQHRIENGVREILKGLGVPLNDPDFLETPERVAKWYIEMFAGQNGEWATFPEKYSDFILLRRHTLWSLCPHHLIPVEMVVSVAYVPNGFVLGLSKLARVLLDCNNKPIKQEEYTNLVVHKLECILPSLKGAACMVEGQHGCAKIRGVRSTGSFLTSKCSGVFDTDKRLQDRFFQLAQK